MTVSEPLHCRPLPKEAPDNNEVPHFCRHFDKQPQNMLSALVSVVLLNNQQDGPARTNKAKNQLAYRFACVLVQLIYT